ncbi:MAG: hypothetical protein D8M58_15065 [Calditrichaeota bacterium]|nr:MAG: hypothetical protein DWQ03_16305 [Calditrichota bacterium]MBL1206724.1 hypothetical protein [Calditrichota bacterium]NOG46550.1 M48 family metallopeptidase [Calditrichota bacterium]
MDEKLHAIISNIKTNYKPAEQYDLRVSYYAYKNLSHTIRLRNGIIYVRISDKLFDAPDETIQAVGYILFDKLFRLKTKKEIRHHYRNYINQFIVPNMSFPKSKVSPDYSPIGKYHNLTDIFDLVNRSYFDSAVPKPILGWSLNKSTRRLGFYDHSRNLLVISRIFDKKRIPDYVREYLMYHEMLHIVIPVKKINGRRSVHPPHFKEKERLFDNYELAQKWLKKKLWRLRF